MSKLKWLLLVLVICILVIVSVVFFINNRTMTRIEVATELGEDVSRYLRGVDIEKTKYPLSMEAKNDLENFITLMKELDNNYYVLLTEKEYEENIADQFAVVAPPDIEDFEGLTDEEIDKKLQEMYQTGSNSSYKDYLESLLNETSDSNLYVESNELRVKVNDLEFNEQGFATVELFGGDYRIFLTEVDKTYQMIQNDPDFIFTYLKSERDKNIVKVYFTSVRTKHILRVDVGFKGKEINSIKVNLPKI